MKTLSQEELDFIEEFRNNKLFNRSFFKNTITSNLDKIVSPVLQERTGKFLLHWYENNLQDYPTCKICNNIIVRMGLVEYNKVCSAKCSGVYSTSNLQLTTEQRKAASIKGAEKNKNRSPEEKIKSREKFKSTLLDKYGEDNPTKIKQFRDKAKATNLEKYGVENPMQCEDVWLKSVNTRKEIYGDNFELIVEKQQSTMMKRYGVIVPMQHQEMREKIKATNLEKYGHEWNIASEESRTKQAETNLKRYGFENICQVPEIKARMNKTIFEKYGVENVSQNPEIHEKKMKTGYQSKTFIFPSGKEVLVQGYEDKALSLLLEEFDETDIVVEQQLIPQIKWTDNHGKNHIYLPDIFIPKENLIIEVKSTYTYNADKENNELKKKFTEKSGFCFKFMVL